MTPENTPPDLAQAIVIYQKVNMYSRVNGMALTVPEAGQADYQMTIRDEHLSSPNTCHGGVVAGLMDAALGAAALTLAFAAQELVSTVEFKINYFLPVYLHDVLLAEARVDHPGKRLVVSNCVIYRLGPNGEKTAVARGQGTFNRYPLNKRDFSGVQSQ